MTRGERVGSETDIGIDGKSIVIRITCGSTYEAVVAFTSMVDDLKNGKQLVLTIPHELGCKITVKDGT